MGLVLFFIALNVWCVDFQYFDIPKTWHRCLGVNDGLYQTRIMPEKLVAFSMALDKERDSAVLRNDIYTAHCKIKAESTFAGGHVFSVRVGLHDEEHQYYCHVYSSPHSNLLGGITLVSPAQELRGIAFSLENGAPPEYFCEYAVGRDSFTVDRLLQQYEDGSQYFVGMTFCYDSLEKVKVSYGTKCPNADGAMVVEAKHLDYDFGPYIHGSSVMQRVL